MSFLIALALLAAGPDAIAKHFEGVDGTFVLLNARTGEIVRHNPARAQVRYPPCSTFKIPNSAISLETGSAPDENYLLKYDPALKQTGAWAQDHTLRSAYKVSALWYYQEMARRTGPERMQRLLAQFGYGNQKSDSAVDKFWIDGTLRISADEQVLFLQRLHDSKLGLSSRTTRLVKSIMIAEEGDGYTLSAKTGACRAEGEEVSLWYVGWVERGADVYYFALQMGGKEYEPNMSQRIPKTRAILKDLEVLP